MAPAGDPVGGETPEDLASMLRSLRAKVLWTQEDLAERSGVSVSTIAGIESGRVRRPRSATLRTLADALDLSERRRVTLAAAARGASTNGAVPDDGDAPDDAVAGDPSPLRWVVPAQLPNAVAGFVGRVGFLRRLDELSTSDGEAVAILAVTGTAGVGKTALTVHWAHRVRHRFPDGQLYANLRGFDPAGPVPEPAEAMRGLLDALGVAPQRIPVDLGAQAALYRSLLSGKRMLVVLDNARDANHVRHLLPGSPGCVVVVTSRNALADLVATDGAHPLTVDLLTTAEAHRLLERRLGRDRVAADPDAVTDIIERCARLPLALAIVAARAATHPRFPLRALADELRGTHLDGFTTDVRAVFSWSYTTLTPGAARLFRLLGPHPGPDISAHAAGSLAGLPLAETRALLAELAGAMLVTERAPGRYASHDLLRAYATELHDAGRRAAAFRLLDHYLHTAYAADRLLNPLRDRVTLAALAAGVTPEALADHAGAQAWLTTEHAVLLGAVAHAGRLRLDTHCWQLAFTLVTFLTRHGRWHDLATAARAAAAAAERLADPCARAYAHRYLARASYLLRQHRDAETHYLRALDASIEAGDDLGQGHTLLEMARMWTERGRARRGLDCAQRAMARYGAAGYRPGHAETLTQIGWCHLELGEYRHALDHCERALPLLRELDDRPWLASTWDSLGQAHHHLTHHPDAVSCYRQALDLFDDLGDRCEQATTLINLGDTQRAAGDASAARSAWCRALTILDDLDHPAADTVRARLSTA